MALVVLKLGGRVATAAAARAHELLDMGNAVVVVHGAGPQITAEMEARGITPQFVGGRRVTTPEVLDVVSASLRAVNAEVCRTLGERAIGLHGDEIGLPAAPVAELGLVGDPLPSAPGEVLAALAQGRIPVVSPLAAGPLNVNADEAAAALAVGLGADRIEFVSDVPGVILEGAVAERLDVETAERMLSEARFEGGIVPKLLAAVHAARSGVHASIGVTEVVAGPEVSPTPLASDTAVGRGSGRFRGVREAGSAPADSGSAGRDRVLPTYARADLTIVRGEGCRVWDDAGRAYLDFGGGIAVTTLGHVHPAVTAAAHAQLDRLWHASNLYWTEPMLRLASLLSDRLGGVQTFFCNSGAEANEAAIKYARKLTGRPRVVALDGGFHGRTLGALSVTGQPAKWEGFGPLVPGVSFVPPNDTEGLERAISPGGDVALVLLEPILGEGGVVPLERSFVQAATEIAREVGAVVCADEVQTGVGRTGTFLACEQLGVEPDLVTLAKGLANGLPIGALLVRDRVAGGLAPGDHGSTFGGNPVAAAAACAVVEAIDEELLADVRARGAELTAALRGLPGVLEVRGAGLLVGALLDRPAGPVVDACRDEGLIVLSAGPDVLRLAPPLVVAAGEIEEAVAALSCALAMEHA